MGNIWMLKENVPDGMMKKAETGEANQLWDEIFNGNMKIFCLQAHKEKINFLYVVCKTAQILN